MCFGIITRGRCLGLWVVNQQLLPGILGVFLFSPAPVVGVELGITTDTQPDQELFLGGGDPVAIKETVRVPGVAVSYRGNSFTGMGEV